MGAEYEYYEKKATPFGPHMRDLGVAFHCGCASLKFVGQFYLIFVHLLCNILVESITKGVEISMEVSSELIQIKYTLPL